MHETVKVDWRVPAAVWEKFKDYVRDRYGTTENGYLGREAEFAMRAYLDQDGYAGVEEQVNRLVEAAGYDSGNPLEEKNSAGEDALANADTSRVTVRVHPDVKDDFTLQAKQSDDTYGVEFAKAVRARYEGGRPARLERNLETVTDELVRLLSEIGGSTEKTKLTTEEKRTMKVCRALDGEFFEDDLVDAIKTEAGVSSEPSIEKYRTNVTERLGVEPHPNNPDLYVPIEIADEIAPDGEPAEVRRPVWFLDHDEQTRRIHYVLGHHAAKRSSGVARFSREEVRDIVFNRELSETEVRARVEDAIRTDGYQLTSINGTEKLEVDLTLLREMMDSDERLCELNNEIIAYRDGVDLDTYTAGVTLDEFNTQQSVATDGSGGGEEG